MKLSCGRMRQSAASPEILQIRGNLSPNKTGRMRARRSSFRIHHFLFSVTWSSFRFSYASPLFEDFRMQFSGYGQECRHRLFRFVGAIFYPPFRKAALPRLKTAQIVSAVTRIPKPFRVRSGFRESEGDSFPFLDPIIAYFNTHFKRVFKKSSLFSVKIFFTEFHITFS